MVAVKSIDFKLKDGATFKTISSKKRDLDNVVAESDGLDNLLIEESICFKEKKTPKLNLQRTVSFKNVVINKVDTIISSPQHANMLSPRPASELDAAATKLQKAYKSYRTCRNLADCAVVVEELWWKALDFAALCHCSISFFESDRRETAVSRWARARTRVAKVGKGLSKDKKAQKLALRHWLEAIDPRHRYGNNLHLYHDVWFGSESSQPFFYWLDVGDGKEVNLETCLRTQLQCQCIKYLGPKEREAYEVIVESGKLVYRQNGMPVDTVEGTKWIFVLSASRDMYVGQKEKGLFQHSSFLAGGAAIAAGRLVAHSGVLEAVWSYSGHYRPTEDNFMEFISFLEEQHVDLTNVKKCPMDDDIPPNSKVIDEELKLESIVDATENVSSTNTEDVGATGHNRAISNANISNEGNVEAQTFELGKPLSCKWTTGFGPRISCVREYPAELQFKALEHVNLSPRLMPRSFGGCFPIPSPRPSQKIHLSPRLACMGLSSPRVQVSNDN